jgi:hypothetical protein
LMELVPSQTTLKTTKLNFLDSQSSQQLPK